MSVEVTAYDNFPCAGSNDYFQASQEVCNGSNIGSWYPITRVYLCIRQSTPGEAYIRFADFV